MKKVLSILIIIGLSLSVNLMTVSADKFDSDKVNESVFVVYSGDYLGSGFAISDHYVVTNAHVIGEEKDIQLKTVKDKVLKASIEKIDRKKDIAILYVKKKQTPLQTKSLKDVKTGDDVYAIGAPANLSYTLTKGVVSTKNRKVDGKKYIQTDAAINSGNSGGPLLTEDGKVIGINSMKADDNEGIGFAIPIDEANTLIKGIGKDSKKKDEKSTEKATGKQKKDDDVQIQKDKNVDLNNVIFVALCISGALNILLIILLVFSRTKTKKKKIDPSERTDFDIDILE